MSPDLGLLPLLLAPIIGPEPLPLADCDRMPECESLSLSLSLVQGHLSGSYRMAHISICLCAAIRIQLSGSKTRDPNPVLRRLSVEIVHLLVVNRAERTFLRHIQIVRPNCGQPKGCTLSSIHNAHPVHVASRASHI